MADGCGGLLRTFHGDDYICNTHAITDKNAGRSEYSDIGESNPGKDDVETNGG